MVSLGITDVSSEKHRDLIMKVRVFYLKENLAYEKIEIRGNRDKGNIRRAMQE